MSCTCVPHPCTWAAIRVLMSLKTSIPLTWTPLVYLCPATEKPCNLRCVKRPPSPCTYVQSRKSKDLLVNMHIGHPREPWKCHLLLREPPIWRLWLLKPSMGLLGRPWPPLCGAFGGFGNAFFDRWASCFGAWKGTWRCQSALVHDGALWDPGGPLRSVGGMMAQGNSFVPWGKGCGSVVHGGSWAHASLRGLHGVA